MTDESPNDAGYEFADFILDVEEHQLHSKSGAATTVSGNKLQILCFFLRHPLKRFTITYIADHSGVSSGIPQYISKLNRRFLGESRLIEAVEGAYRLNVEARPLTQERLTERLTRLHKSPSTKKQIDSLASPDLEQTTTKDLTARRQARSGRSVKGRSASHNTEHKPIDSRFSVGECCPDSILLFGGNGKRYSASQMAIQYAHKFVELPRELRGIRDRAEERKKAGDLNYFSGPTTRLHGWHRGTDAGTEIETPVLDLRPSRWRDFIGSNEVLDEKLKGVNGERTTIRAMFADSDRLSRTLDPSWIPLSNMMTVNSVLLTRDGYTLIGHRLESVSNDRNLLTCSVAESMQRWLDEPSNQGKLLERSNGDDWWYEENRLPYRKLEIPADYKPALAPQPVHTVRRGIWEEVAMKLHDLVPNDRVEILGLGWDLKLFIPFLVTVVRVETTITDVERMVRAGGSRWETRLHKVQFTPSAISAFMRQTQSNGLRWTRSGLTTLLLSLMNEFGLEDTQAMFRENIAEIG